MNKGIVLLAYILLASGCASVTGSKMQPISVQTIHESKEVAGIGCTLTNDAGKWFVTTPGSVTVNKSTGDMAVDCIKDVTLVGHETLVSKSNGAVWGNILLGGGIGYVVDRNTGAGFDYPTTITVMLRRAGGSTGVDAPIGVSTEGSRPILLASNIAPNETMTSSAAASQGDPCDYYTTAGEKCWWSPPGAPSNSICPTVAALKDCTKYYGSGCRIGHGKSLPGC